MTDDLKRKAKGKMQKIKGELNEERGEGLKGGWQKLKGEANQRIADLDIDLNTEKDRPSDDR